MRTLLEIIEAARDGKEIGMEEATYALLALDALWGLERGSLLYICRNMSGPAAASLAGHEMSETLKRARTALNKDPKEWVGWNNDPKNPEYQERRKASFGLVKKVLGVDLRKPPGDDGAGQGL